MKRLCDVCRGVYANNSSFSEHQRKTGHKQIASTNGDRTEKVELTKDQGQLQDSLKVKEASIAQLNDSLKTKDELISSLEDSIKTRDAEFGTLHDEIATLNDKNKYLESNEYLKTYLLKLTPEAFDQLGAALFTERATVEDSNKLADEMYQVLRAVQVSLSDDRYYQEFKPLIKNVDAVLAKAEKHVTKLKDSTQDGAEAARGAHNAEVVGSSPAPATTAPVVAPVADSKPVEEPSIVFYEMKDAGWTWYPALGYSIKN